MRQWLSLCKRDLLHSASGTNYCLGRNVKLSALAFSLLSSELQIVILYRVYSAIYQNGLEVIGLLIYLFVKFVYKCDIHPKCKIGSGFLLVHGFGIVIGPDVEIGCDVVVFNGVNMGKKNVGVMYGAMPKIGNQCVIGTGSKLLGGIKLGNSVSVGANAVVLEDIPAYSVCVGIPARVVKTNSQ